jgi:hypothetical protein
MERSVGFKKRMLRRTNLAIVCSAAIVASACTLGFGVAIRYNTLGRMDFRVWRTISSEAHGGGYIRVNGAKLYYETFGHALPQLLSCIAGWVRSYAQSDSRARGDARMVAAIDSRGHGRSSDNPAPLSYGVMADGHSQGS